MLPARMVPIRSRLYGRIGRGARVGQRADHLLGRHRREAGQRDVRDRAGDPAADRRDAAAPGADSRCTGARRGVVPGSERVCAGAASDHGHRLLRPGSARRHLLSRGRAAGQARQRRLAGGRVRPHLALGRRRRAVGTQDPRAGAVGAQRLHRVVGSSACARGLARRGAAVCLRTASRSSRSGAPSASPSAPTRLRWSMHAPLLRTI